MCSLRIHLHHRREHFLVLHPAVEWQALAQLSGLTSLEVLSWAAGGRGAALMPHRRDCAALFPYGGSTSFGHCLPGNSEPPHPPTPQVVRTPRRCSARPCTSGRTRACWRSMPPCCWQGCRRCSTCASRRPTAASTSHGAVKMRRGRRGLPCVRWRALGAAGAGRGRSPACRFSGQGAVAATSGITLGGRLMSRAPCR